jgi:hypothetical protein
MTPAEIVEGMREVQERLRQLLIAAQALEGSVKEKRGRKYSDADRKRWRDMAAKPDLILHSNRSKSLLIARREGLPRGAAETIRRLL